LLPNTSGARNAKEAILAAELGREALETKLDETRDHPVPLLLPDRWNFIAAQELVKRGFHCTSLY